MTSPGPGNDDGSAASFVRGLTIGALLGAAVAGSSLWSRRRRARKAREAAAIPAPGPNADQGGGRRPAAS